MDDGVSKYYQSEAESACHAVRFLLEGGQCSMSDLVVVTPHAAQARPFRCMLRSLLQNTGPPFIEVSSVDGFQGRRRAAPPEHAGVDTAMNDEKHDATSLLLGCA